MSNWKNKLESISKVPGEPLDKDRAWEKLYARMEERPRKKSKLFYWSAAAAVILIAATIYLFRTKTSPGVNPGELVHKNEKSSTLPLPGKTIRPVITIIPPDTLNIVKKPTRKSLLPLNAKTDDAEHTKIVKDVLADTTQLATQTVVVKPERVNDLVLPKKKLKVVHINELGKQTEEVIMAQRPPAGRFFIKNNASLPEMQLPAAQNNSIRIIFNSTN